MSPVPKVKGKERTRTKKGTWRKKRKDRIERQKMEFLEARKGDILDKIEALKNELAIVNVLLTRTKQQKVEK